MLPLTELIYLLQGPVDYRLPAAAVSLGWPAVTARTHYVTKK